MFEERNPKERKISVSLYRWMFFFSPFFGGGGGSGGGRFHIGSHFLSPSPTYEVARQTHLLPTCGRAFVMRLTGWYYWVIRVEKCDLQEVDTCGRVKKLWLFFFFFFENNVTYVTAALSWLSKIKNYHQNVRWIWPTLSTYLHESLLRP